MGRMTSLARRHAFRAAAAGPLLLCSTTPWWWWRRNPALVPGKATTMMILGVLLSAAGLGFFCWALFNLAVFALPFFAGLTAGLAALHSGSGATMAIAVGFTVAVLTLTLGQSVFALVRSTPVRIAVALLFAAPAVIAGYHMTLHLSALVATADVWRHAFALVGAAVVGVTAVGRLMLPASAPEPLTTLPLAAK